jgi:hypothetical protein
MALEDVKSDFVTNDENVGLDKAKTSAITFVSQFPLTIYNALGMI